MYKSKLRLLGVSALVGAGLIAAGPADAYNIRLGDVDIQIDTTMSVGAQWRVEDRNLGFLSERQGSDHVDTTQGHDAMLAVIQGGAAALAACGTANDKPAAALSVGSFCMYNQSYLADYKNDGTKYSRVSKAGDPIAPGSSVTHLRGDKPDVGDNDVSLGEVYNYDRGINGDDGRLNFDNGDMTGGTLKATFDVEASMGIMRAFARVNAFYDAVMADDNSFERTELLDDADDSLVTDIKVLDAYVDFDLDLFGQPLLIRAGKQVINWGESTFILGGNSAFNPIDVPAFRRPGAEVKEALIPVNALYASVALPYDLSVEAYVGEWEDFELDAAGGPFSTSDAFVKGSAGNIDKFYSGTGTYAGSNRRNCNGHEAAGNTILGSSKDATRLSSEVMNDLFGSCEVDSANDFRYTNPAGNVEAGRKLIAHEVQSGANAGEIIGDTDFMTRGTDIEPEDDENYGLAIRWYAENLNSTEFGLYYQKGYSRIPYVSGIARTPSIGPSVTGVGSSSTLRGAGLSGCLAQFDSTNFQFARSAGAANGVLDSTYTFLPAGTFTNQVGSDEMEDIILEDSTGLGAAWRAELFDGGANQTAVIAQAAAAMDAKLQTVDADADTDGIQSSSPGVGALTAVLGGIVSTHMGQEDGSLAQAVGLGCVAAFANSTSGALLGTGATSLAHRYEGELFAEYPEIETIGLSFATTVLGWGVQGEVAVRDEMPLQLDTDALYIATISASCAWENFAAVGELYYTLQTIQTTCGQFNETISGYRTEQAITYDIGTTATFTRSNPVISALGADIGILLTEIGHQVVDNVEEGYRGQNADLSYKPRLASKCTTGSDLPLGGVFGLDPRTSDDCRPTDESTGIVLFGQLQYNNVFGTPWGLQPTILHREGISGMSPVAGGFVEGVKSTSLSLNASRQGNLSVNLGYVMYNGDELYDVNIDRDTASLTVTYGF